ncbi:hypothetical protein IM876_24860 [Serratia plymuthica]|uniref:hypothetical protein n=1 Tax=Serratia plymuthica TaxID=82996 RepID=UPI001928B47F|nr:hypothetical protein [Serratia plymuthica]MBL3525898.1 hypothetical protein [Serratia plymuthica]
MKGYLVEKDINETYYKKTISYIHDISLALLGTGLYCALKNQIDLNNPAGWVVVTFICISLLWWIAWDLKAYKTRVYIKPSKNRYKNNFSKLADILVRFMIGITCASFYDWMLAAPEEDFRSSLIFFAVFAFFHISLVLFGYYTVNLPEDATS